MITAHVFIAASLDGFIARENGDIGWLIERNDPAEDYGYNRFIDRIDAIIMGRATFEKVRHMGPWTYDRPVFVMSSRLTEKAVPEELRGNIHFTNKPPRELLAMLESAGHQRVYVDGGQVVQSFLANGLIDDIILTHVPILLGSGRPLFGHLSSDIPMTLERTCSFPSGLVQSHYRLSA